MASYVDRAPTVGMQAPEPMIFPAPHFLLLWLLSYKCGIEEKKMGQER